MAHAASPPFATAMMPHAGQKRARDDAEVEDESVARGMRFDKVCLQQAQFTGCHMGVICLSTHQKARPTSGDSASWPRDSVISTPRSHQQTKYDSDDQSSMVSEPGSPQDIDMSSDDDMMQDSDSMPAFSQSPEQHFPSSAVNPSSKPPYQNSSPWHARTSQNRVPTPSIPHQSRPGIRPVQIRTGFQSAHVRGRHPQENISSDPVNHLEVPSPIDEDEVPTPPSAAEAAGSQFSMLTVNDMDIEPPPDSGLPTISVDDQDASAGAAPSPANLDSAIDVEPMDDTVPSLTVRKPRQRSGAVSSGHGGSPSPVRGEIMGMGQKRGFSMGFRADCEKCRLRVPGHLNHFVAS